MGILLLVFVISVPGIIATFGPLEHCRIYPPDVEACLREAKFHPGNVHQAHDACLRTFFSRTGPDNNMTMADRAFFDYRVQNRYGYGPPPTGSRIRREYRRLTDKERYRLHAAFHVLYKRGIVGHFARLYAAATHRIHHGPAFLPWQRVFLTSFEEELRRIDPTVSLPYWDFTLDEVIPDPAHSVLWTSCFFGNGNGSIQTGPFAGWHGASHGRIQRYQNQNGRLFHKMDIDAILSKCHYAEIAIRTGKGNTNLEEMMVEVMKWVGGDMTNIPLAGFDPIFYMLHTFIDSVWELFRKKQLKVCKIDPEKDYGPPLKIKGQRALDVMFGYEHLLNKHGLLNAWTEHYYKYESQPQCPDCGSPYLFCNKKIDPKLFPAGLCASKTFRVCPSIKNTIGGMFPPGYPGHIHFDDHHWGPRVFIGKHHAMVAMHRKRHVPAPVHVWHHIKVRKW